MEWYSLPFEFNFLDELLERVTEQMPYYDDLDEEETKSMRTSFMILVERNFNTQVDEIGDLMCDYVCQTLDDNGCSVRINIKWFQVIGVLRRHDDESQIERVIAHPALLVGDILEVCTDIVRSMGSKCVVAPQNDDEENEIENVTYLGQANYEDEDSSDGGEIELKSSSHHMSDSSLLNALDRLRRFDSSEDVRIVVCVCVYAFSIISLCVSNRTIHPHSPSTPCLR